MNTPKESKLEDPRWRQEFNTCPECGKRVKGIGPHRLAKHGHRGTAFGIFDGPLDWANPE